MKEYFKVLIFYLITGAIIVSWNVATKDFLGIRSTIEVIQNKDTFKMLFSAVYFPCVIVYTIITISAPAMFLMILKEVWNDWKNGYSLNQRYLFKDAIGVAMTAIVMISETIILVNIIF